MISGWWTSCYRGLRASGTSWWESTVSCLWRTIRRKSNDENCLLINPCVYMHMSLIEISSLLKKDMTWHDMYLTSAHRKYVWHDITNTVLSKCKAGINSAEKCIKSCRNASFKWRHDQNWSKVKLVTNTFRLSYHLLSFVFVTEHISICTHYT